jgi:hypothetical protein
MCGCVQTSSMYRPVRFPFAPWLAAPLGGRPRGAARLFLPASRGLWLPSSEIVTGGGITLADGAFFGPAEDHHDAAAKEEGDGKKVKEPCKDCKKEFVCGPDVTKQVKDAVHKTQKEFKSWTTSDKDDACRSLTSLSTGEVAWDITDLHANGWILNYRPKCATEGAHPGCGSTIQVGSDCYYAGAVNYVIFGVMCRLCYDFRNAEDEAIYESLPPIAMGDGVPPNTAWPYSQGAMQVLISGHKLIHPGSTDNEPVKAWAKAGWNGWPDSGAAPPGDYNHCKPICPEKYHPTSYTRPRIVDKPLWPFPEEEEPGGLFEQSPDGQFQVHWGVHAF